MSERLNSLPDPNVHTLQSEIVRQPGFAVRPDSNSLDVHMCSDDVPTHGVSRQSNVPTPDVPAFEPDQWHLACFELDSSYYNTYGSAEQVLTTPINDVWPYTSPVASIIAPEHSTSQLVELPETEHHDATASVGNATIPKANATTFAEDLDLDRLWLYGATPALSIDDSAINEAAIMHSNYDSTCSTQLDFWKSGLTTMPLPNDVPLDPEIKNALTTHYFDRICQILSCFDSHENPFRADIPQKMLTCEYIDDCVVGMSASHLANSVSGMENIALRHRNRAMSALTSVIQSLLSLKDQQPEQSWLTCTSTRLTRHHALLASLLLGISSVSTLAEPELENTY